MRQISLRVVVIAGLLLVAGGAFALLLAPRSMGGDVGYVLVRAEHDSDVHTNPEIVLVRTRSSYTVGDDVIYEGGTGLARGRVAAIDGAQLQVDARSDEPVEVPYDGIVGGVWVTIPGAGRAATTFIDHRIAVLTSFAAIALAAALLSRWQRGANEGRLPVPIVGSGLIGRLSWYSPGAGPATSILLAIVVASAGVLALVSLRGTDREVTETLPFSARGVLTYGRAVQGGVYDLDRLRAPEPVFRRLTDELPVEFRFDLTPDTSAGTIEEVTGSYQLLAEVNQPNGWSRTVPLRSATLFAEPSVVARGTLELALVDDLVASLASTTGVEPGITTLRIIADVFAEGSLAGAPFQSTFTQAMEFRLTELQLQFLPANSELEHVESGGASHLIREARQIEVPRTDLVVTYTALRPIGAAGLAIGALGLATLATATALTWRTGEGARLRARYGHRIVEAKSEIAPGTKPLDVRTFGDLIRLADRDGLLIVHHEDPLAHEYFVFEREVTYRHTRWKDEDLARTLGMEVTEDLELLERALQRVA